MLGPKPWRWGWAAVLVGACQAAVSERATERPPTSRAEGVAHDAGAPASDAAAASPAPAQPTQLDPDGNDDGEESDGLLPARGRFVKVGRHFAALTRICDLTAFRGKLYASHATRPLMFSGATITRYDPDSDRFELMFDWNRPGQPEKGGGAGQGFLRVRAIDDRLYVPDGDPPYLGLGLTRFGVEGYVFASSSEGRFAPARRPGHLPPAQVQGDAAGSHVLPGALHVFDVIRFRGKRYASTGSVLKDWTKSGASPAALHVASEGGPWEVVATHPDPPRRGTWRFRYLVRFRDRLYAALTDFAGADGFEYVVFAPPHDSMELSSGKPVQVTRAGGAPTLRWFTDRGKLYWIVAGGLLVSDDGDRWRPVVLPETAGHPTDLARVGDALVVLTENSLLRLDANSAREIAKAPDGKRPFRLDDSACAAPLAVLGGRLYAGGQVRGNLYRLEADPEPPPVP